MEASRFDPLGTLRWQKIEYVRPRTRMHCFFLEDEERRVLQKKV